MYFYNSYASNLNGMRYVVWMSIRHQWNRPLNEVTSNRLTFNYMNKYSCYLDGETPIPEFKCV